MKVYLCTTCNKTVPLKNLGEHREHCTTELALERGGTGQGMGGRIGRAMLAIVLAIIGIVLGVMSFSSVRSMRQLERIPATEVHAVLPGEANLSGKAVKLDKILKGPKSGKPCFYFRYLVEREEKDSDGDTTWRTVEDRTEFLNFKLKDATGTIPVILSGDVDFSLPRSFRTRQGNMRYSEWRIDPNNDVFLFGMVVDKDGTYSMLFDVEGDYDPIVSKYDEASERLDMAGTSLLMCWGSLVLLAFAVAFMVRSFGVHRLLVFFGILSTVILIDLTAQGLLMMVGDLKAGSARLQRHKTTAEKLIQDEMRKGKTAWEGDWTTLKAFSEYPNLAPASAARLKRIRLDVALATERVQKQRAAFPENIVSTLAGIPRHGDLPLPDADRVDLAKMEGAFVSARVPRALGGGIIAGGILIGLLSFLFGFRSIRNKRCMENVPTSPTSGAVFGLAEFKGIVGPAPDEVPLTSPLTRTPCVYYTYLIEERRGSGKDAKWVTISNTEDRCDCTCVDGDGAIAIDTEGADIMTRHTSVQRHGRRRHTETRLELHDPLYVIGECAIHPRHADQLYVHKPEDSFPFILSNMTEKAVTESIAGKGIAQLNMAFASVLLIGLTFFGLFGSFGADDYLTSAMLAPVFMLFVTLVLHFNDLVFLRQRVNRNASNIDVSLKKRHDLLPNLEQIVKSYMSHESEVMKAMTELRTAYGQQDKNNPDSIGQYMLAEHNAVGHVIARMEAYPDLKASKEATMLMRTMVALENEIALMREGYNNSVETYNTRIETLPDMIFAKAFGFKGRNYIQAEVGETVLPDISSLNEAVEAEADAETDAPALPVAQAVRPAPAALLREPLTAEQLDASAAIYALLLSTEADARASQLDMILARHDETMVERTKLHVSPIDSADPNDMERLKQAESWYDKLEGLDDEQYRTFTTVLRELVEADDIISLFECALQHSITHRLDLPRSGATMPPTRYEDLELVAGQISVLLSTLMQMEDDVEKTGEGAFQTGLATLGYEGDEPIEFLTADKCTLAAFNAALDDMRHATGTLKAQVFAACSAAVGDNADYTYDQALLLAMIADGFNMDRPDWI